MATHVVFWISNSAPKLMMRVVVSTNVHVSKKTKTKEVKNIKFFFFFLWKSTVNRVLPLLTFIDEKGNG